MNLETAQALATLREPVIKVPNKTRTAIQVAKRVFQLAAQGGFPYKHITPESWAKKWLRSKEFKLMYIDINAAASPHVPKNPNRVAYYMKCNVESFDPIVIDVNKRKVGKTLLGYIPEVIKLDGKHRSESMLRRGHTKVWAWVGCKAEKKLKVSKTINASADLTETIYLPPVDNTRIATAYELHASTTPMVIRQDSGEGGSRPKDHLHSKGKIFKKKKMKSNAGMTGPGMSNQGGGASKPMAHTSSVVKAKKKVKARGDVCGCGARSTGSLEDASASDMKVPPDSSDASTFVQPSDQRKWNPNAPQNKAPGASGNEKLVFGSPNYLAPGSGVGQRVKNTGAHNSDFSREVNAKGKKAKK